MTGASKILTVSYGTFSCTLEGFDDPFNTMKAIAEYFRDLAAEDRYFGAEPPTPDAAMLHRIAEREIQRRVEAKVQDNGVILRAAEEGAVVVDATPAVPALAEVGNSEAAESVAARLRRIRDTQAATQTPAAQTAPALTVAAPVMPAATVLPAAPVLPAAVDARTGYAEDQDAEDPALAAPVVAPATDLPSQLEDLMDEAEDGFAPAETSAAADPQFDLSDDFGDLPEAEDFDPADAAADAPAPVLAPVLAPVSEKAPPAPLAAAEPEEEALLQSLTARLAEDASAAPLAPVAAAPAPARADIVAEDDPFDETGLLARLTDPLPEDQPAPEEPDSTAEVGDDALLAALGTMIDPEGEPREPDQPQAVAPLAAAPAEPAPKAEAQPSAEPVAVMPPAAAPGTAQRARARVIRIRRAEQPAPAAMAAPAPAATPVASPAPATAPAPAAAVSALSDEDEAALQAELAALEAELSPPAPAPAPAATAEVARPAPAPVDQPKAPLAPLPAEAHPLRDQRTEDAVTRLIAKTDTEMEGEDTRRRRSAIAHLKAAVAATVAERKITGSEAPARPARLDSYREDLDRVVRPRRPGSEGAARRGDDDGQPRPAPLVLVSEQRIDRPQPAADAVAAPLRPVMPVRPRRVAVSAEDSPPPANVTAAATSLPPIDEIDEDEADAGDSNIFADAAGFEEFADRLGASSLPDLLEAAAVYCAEVLNRPEFSRPLVMRQLSGLSGNPGASREDCLRGFGTLLRQGRIAKVKRGMFAVTERSPYLAEARKLAG